MNELDYIERCARNLDALEVHGLDNHYRIIECLSDLAELKALLGAGIQNGREEGTPDGEHADRQE